MSALNWEIIKSLLSEIAFFVDKHDRYEVYAEYQKGKGVTHFHPICSRDFEAALRVWYRHHADTDAVPSMQPVLQYIQDECIFHDDFEEVDPCCRIAGDLHRGIEYFLADRARTVIRICDGSWGATNKAEHKFLTTSSHLPQVMPQSCGEDIFTLLAPCFNLTGDDLTLLVIWLVQCFSGGSHYGVMLSAERGSGKSTLTDTLGLLLDPGKAQKTILQTTLDNFQNFLANHYLAAFDNVRTIPTDYSDTLAAAITGGTVAKRKLYSDHDMVYLHLHNVVIMNGIDLFPTESDLAERFLYFRLTKLKSSELKSDHSIKNHIEKNRAKILGCIFDILAKATQDVHRTKAKNPTRMADAYTEMLTIAKVLGLTEADFDRIIRANIKSLHLACATTPLVEAIAEYMNGPAKGSRKVCCSSTRFFNHVRCNYSGPRAALPGRAAEFSKRLKAEHDALRAAGFQSIVDDTGATESTITIIRDK